MDTSKVYLPFDVPKPATTGRVSLVSMAWTDADGQPRTAHYSIDPVTGEYKRLP